MSHATVESRPVLSPTGQGLRREFGLLEACGANILNMVGIGPFITIPLALAAMGGPQVVLAWFLGAGLAVCDGLVWAELGAAMPRSGGPYIYLLEAFGRRGLGRLASFLFLWQCVVVSPLSIASGAVGLGEYAKFLAPHLTPADIKGVAAGSCLLSMVILYRDIRSIGRISLAMLVIVLGTMFVIVFGGVTHFHISRVFDVPPGAWHLSAAFFSGLGSATLIAAYDYGGYYNICLVGGEVRRPERVIPLSILLAIGIVGILYLLMTISVISVVPWRLAMHSTAIVSVFTQTLYGSNAATVMTWLVMFAAFASVFAVMLGCSRVTYAAAVDGHFFRMFARLHPTKNIPCVSLITLGLTSAIACLIDLQSLITALMVIQTMIQFLTQCIAVMCIRARRKEIKLPFQMPWYPLPALLALCGWIYIVATSGLRYVLAAQSLLLLGAAAYLWRARNASEWPFSSHEDI
ncbi:MAG TPA: APC family permease [Candidatus Acidoferrum sp.]|jgi:amino acid transporter|nr:APC family permease [Candidatus Acidoferrum sp.]